MRVTILRPVPVSDNGITIRHLPVGEGDVPEHLVGGLEAAGYIAPAVETKVVGPAPETTAVVPSDWRDLHWKRRVALAEQITGKDGLTADEANAILAEAVR